MSDESWFFTLLAPGAKNKMSHALDLFLLSTMTWWRHRFRLVFKKREINLGKKMSRQSVLTDIERDIQSDWANREYVELITTNIKKISDFLNSFDSR